MSNIQHEEATVRSFLIGTLVSLLIGLGIAYADNAIRGSYMAFDFGSPVAVFFLFVIVALLNPLAGWIRRAWFLSEAEITLVFIMALVAASIPAMGLTGFFLPYLSGAQYYASPENGWAELFMHYTPDWLIVQDQQAIKNFYEGNPQGAGGIPWKAWLPAGGGGHPLEGLATVFTGVAAFSAGALPSHDRFYGNPAPPMDDARALALPADAALLGPDRARKGALAAAALALGLILVWSGHSLHHWQYHGFARLLSCLSEDRTLYAPTNFPPQHSTSTRPLLYNHRFFFFPLVVLVCASGP